jgi:Protein of unknown function
MNTTELDDLILSFALPYWQKVAMIIVKVTRSEKFSFESRDEEFNFVAIGISRLVENGQLESQGDISQWRFSEVRISNP